MAPVAARAYSAVENMGGDAIVCDTGGTTFDVGLVRDGQLVYSRDSWLGPQWLGDIIGASTVDVRSIGAGGGSIACSGSARNRPVRNPGRPVMAVAATNRR